jgi:hypothetical protein
MMRLRGWLAASIILSSCSSDSNGSTPDASAGNGGGEQGGTAGAGGFTPGGGGFANAQGGTAGSGAVSNSGGATSNGGTANGGTANGGIANGGTASSSGGAVMQGGAGSAGGTAPASGGDHGLDASAPGTDGGETTDAGSGGASSDANTPCLPLTTQLLTSTLDSPVYVTAPPGDPRLFVVERAASKIVLVDGAGKVLSTFLDVSSKASSAGFEAGLLSLAFDPSFATTRAFYVTYTTTSILRVSRFTVPSATPNVADPASESMIIEAPQASHHNTGGMLQFGPDGFLYIGLGDDDDDTRGQNLGTLSAKLLRIAVDPTKAGYTSPADNPFLHTAGARPEIFAYGLREPYRFWFDTPTRDLIIADVGDATREELDVVRAESKGGENFGWPIMEGTLCHQPLTGCDKTGLTLPVYDYTHDGETAIIGGSVYRGTALSACWRGRYFFGTYTSGVIDSVTLTPTAVDVQPVPTLSEPSIVSFGQDGNGELLLLGYDQAIYRIVSKH